MTNIKGYDFKKITIRDSYNRRALQYKNKIISYLKNFGLPEDDINISLERICMRKTQASVSWYIGDDHLFYSYNGCAKFVENLAMVAEVVLHFFNQLEEGEIDEEEFLKLFAEDNDIIKQRKNARDVLGVHEDSADFDTMHKNYKKLSKEHHPDMPNGNTEKFKQINAAHKILKKELK